MAERWQQLCPTCGGGAHRLPAVPNPALAVWPIMAFDGRAAWGWMQLPKHTPFPLWFWLPCDTCHGTGLRPD